MELDFTADQDELRDADPRRARQGVPGRARPRGRRAPARDPTELWTTMVELGWPAPHRRRGARRHRARHGRGRDPRRGARARASRPGPLLPTITQFVPAVRECGTPEQQSRCSSAGRRPASVAGTLAIAERERIVRPGRYVGHDVTADGDDVVLVGRRSATSSKATRSTSSSSCAAAAGRPATTGVRAVVVPASAAATTAPSRVRRQPPPRARRTSTT